MILLLVLPGCQEEEEGTKDNALVHIVFPPEAVGDQGYNDMILHGIQQAAENYGFTLAMHIPVELEHGMEIYREWVEQPVGEGHDRSLFIFAGSEYESFLKSQSRPDDSRKDILLFETDTPMEGVYTFRVGSYAACYLAGATGVWNIDEEQKALIVAANPQESNVKTIVDGFRDGYIAAGGDECEVIYLGKELTEGFDQADAAYKLCRERVADYSFFFPAAGSSNKGMYRFSRETYSFVAGMDGDMSLFSLSIPFSVVKHMDEVVLDLVSSLLEGKEVPQHQEFLYSSGYEELVFAEGFSKDDFKDISDIWNNIEEIERNYEETR